MILRPFCVFSPFSLFISCKVLYNWTKAEAFLSVFAVVLLAEDVDRNIQIISILANGCVSSSSRRTWIEICGFSRHRNFCYVVLLAEDVDRNMATRSVTGRPVRSSSSRRTWIEILPSLQLRSIRLHVVLLAEDVDRNFDFYDNTDVEPGRPPRGGRG